jgi:hypothetical protein
MSQSPLSARQRSDGATATAVEEAKTSFVKMGVDYWQSLRGQSRFPARAKLTLRGMAAFLPYAVIIAVVDSGADYEYRYV